LFINFNVITYFVPAKNIKQPLYTLTIYKHSSSLAELDQYSVLPFVMLVLTTFGNEAIFKRQLPTLVSAFLNGIEYMKPDAIIPPSIQAQIQQQQQQQLSNNQQQQQQQPQAITRATFPIVAYTLPLIASIAKYTPQVLISQPESRQQFETVLKNCLLDAGLVSEKKKSMYIQQHLSLSSFLYYSL